MKQPHYELNIADNVGGKMYVVDPSDRIRIAAAATTDAFFEAPYLNGNVIVHKPYYDAAINGRFNFTDNQSTNKYDVSSQHIPSHISHFISEQNK